MQKGQGIYKITKTIRVIRGCICRRHGDIWEYQDDTRDGIRWDMLNGTGIVNMEIQGGYR